MNLIKFPYGTQTPLTGAASQINEIRNWCNANLGPQREAWDWYGWVSGSEYSGIFRMSTKEQWTFFALKWLYC